MKSGVYVKKPGLVYEVKVKVKLTENIHEAFVDYEISVREVETIDEVDEVIEVINVFWNKDVPSEVYWMELILYQISI